MPPRRPAPPRVGPRPPTSRAPWIEGSAVVVAANRVAKALAKHAVWKHALVGSSPSNQPVVVQRLDRKDDYYYIVEFANAGRLTARMAMGGRDGKLLRCNAVSRANSALRRFVTPPELLRSREGKPFGIGAARERLVRTAAVGVHPVLVWKDCAQSRSPLLPFYVLTVGDSLSYLRVDGTFFHILRAASLGR